MPDILRGLPVNPGPQGPAGNDATQTTSGCVLAPVVRNGSTQAGLVSLTCGEQPPVVLMTFQCGNGRLDAGESCDDGNLANGDGCDSRCVLECDQARLVCDPTACQPDCAARECGTDGCGGSCGVCSRGETCDAGQCVGSGGCPNGQVEDCAGVCGGNAVVDCAGTCGGTAMPDCRGVCGGDAVEDCAGTCGGTATLDCRGICGGDARPDCTGRTCGDDGCGGSCGVCPRGETCTAASV